MNKKLYIPTSIVLFAAGLFPLLFLLKDTQFELISSANPYQISNSFSIIGFYPHSIFGGIALLTGWLLFSKKLLNKHFRLYIIIAKIYIVTTILSAIGIIYVGFFTSGGSIIITIGFISLGLIWFYSSLKAFSEAKEKNIREQQKMMLYSYAACFSVITLRLWLILLGPVFKDINITIMILAWWSWIPNLIIAYIINRRMEIRS